MTHPQNWVRVDLGELRNTCFVAMPFEPIYSAEYERVIRPAVEETGLTCIRGDEIFSKPNIVADIWAAIRQSRLIIAELSDRNANVLYEVGLAHAVGKPAILLTRNEEDVPFDLKGLRYLYYDTGDPFWGNNLGAAITRMISAILSESDLAVYLDGIEMNVTSPSVAAVAPLTPSQPKVSLNNTTWTALWGSTHNRHSGTLVLTQQDVELNGTLVVTHEHNGVPTIVQESLKGSIEDDRVTLSGTSYTFLRQGQCDRYGLDGFYLTISEDRRTLKGTIPQKNATHEVCFERVD